MNNRIEFLSKGMGWIVAIFIIVALFSNTLVLFFGCMLGAVTTMTIWFFMADHASRRWE